MNLVSLAELFNPVQLETGIPFYLVGGSVRDALLGRPSKDLDIATPSLPETLLKILPGSAMVNSSQAYPIVIWEGLEIASFRNDGVNRKDAESIKLGATIEEDALRRDFTMNALYYSIPVSIELALKGILGKHVVDPTGFGFADIENKKISFVGSPKQRIQEDPLRILRAYRFKAQLPEFTFCEETDKALKFFTESLRMK